MPESFKSTPTDGLDTDTSRSQHDTEALISTIFETITGPEQYILDRKAHMNFAAKLLLQGFPGRYVSQDASQPWLSFWILQSFQILGVAFDPATKLRAIHTIMRNQHPDGGFGGGPQQSAHLLTTYASVCSLAIVGSPGDQGGWDQIDRKKMYDWFMELKQPDGSFLVAKNAEVDVRGMYCLLVVATLLDLITPELVRGLPEFVASCQTYEGGFSAASQPYFSGSPPSLENLLPRPRPSLGEAHGGYTFCAVASLALLEPLAKTPPRKNTKIWMGINVRTLYRWATSMQGLECEGGGFKGRTNKLVDGCYSWWVGGLFPILDDIMGGGEDTKEPHVKSETAKSPGADSEDWADDDGGLFNRNALQSFILISSQSKTGGLRDKPGRPADAYHTLYNLSGLSSAQHHMVRTTQARQDLVAKWVTVEKDEDNDDDEREALRKKIFIESVAWAEDESAERYVGGKENRVNATHPIFDMTLTASKAIMNHFYGQSS